MIIMHGLFDLNDAVDAKDFRQSFNRFADHLESMQMVTSARFMRHQEHDGYNAREPATEYYVAMEFLDLDHAQKCWDYIEEHQEPLESLHAAVFSKVRNSSFFLTADE